MVVLQPYISAHLWLLHQTDMKERHATERRTRQFLDLTFCNLISLYYARSHSPLKPQQNKECALWMGGGEKQDNGGGKGGGEEKAQRKRQNRPKSSKLKTSFFTPLFHPPTACLFPRKLSFPLLKRKFLIRGEILLSIKLLSSAPKPFVFGWPLLAPAAGCCHDEAFNFFVCLPCLCTHFVIGRGKFLEIACAYPRTRFQTIGPWSTSIEPSQVARTSTKIIFLENFKKPFRLATQAVIKARLSLVRKMGFWRCFLPSLLSPWDRVSFCRPST